MAKQKPNIQLVEVPETPKVIEKQVDPALQAKSVVDTPSVNEGRTPFGSIMLMALSAADTFIPWGTDVMARDAQLRTFVAQEPTLSSGIYSVCVRNASFEWEIVSADPTKDPKRTIAAVTEMLENSDWGRGWLRHMIKTCFDLYTQDNGAIWELIRAQNSPDSPVIMIASLDSAHCFRTGDPKVPIIYHDRKGKWHEMQWFNVVTLEEMPVPVERLYNTQMCAVSRALKMIQIVRDMLIYKHEKVSGRNPRAIDFVSGVTAQEVEDAIKYAEEQANNKGLLRFPSYHIVAGVDPSNPVAHERIDLASLPDNFNFDDEMKWYVAILAMALGVDYQELAPLPGGQMGSSQQSEILHLKTRGKGPAALMTLITHIMNNSGIIPRNVKFRFKFHDIEAEKAKAEAEFARAKSRAIRLDSGELDPEAARRLAVETGDLPQWLADEMKTRAQEPNMTKVRPLSGNVALAGPNPNSNIPEVPPGAEVPVANARGKKPNPLTINQITGGGEAHPQVKSKGGMASLTEYEAEVEVGKEDIALERKDLARQLLAEED